MNFQAKEELVKRIRNFDVKDYEKTRNYIDGSVSKLSPYITHGVITLPEIISILKEKYSASEMYKFIFELAWREYFQNVWSNLGSDIFHPILKDQDSQKRIGIPKSVLEAKTGIQAIDQAIIELYETGYMHNHARMWVAALVCNFGKCSFESGAKWLYYHLKDGDLASNTLSWQWVAGTFSSRPYIMNQDNINKYSKTDQKDTFLDRSYEELADLKEIPDILSEIVEFSPQKYKLDENIKEIPTEGTVYLHSIWNLNPDWHKNKARHLVLNEGTSYEKFHMSKMRLNFIKECIKQIPGAEIINQTTLDQIKKTNCKIVTKYHPSNLLPELENENPDKIFPEINRYYSSFSKFWNIAKKNLKEI